MGHLVNPISLRVGKTLYWNVIWSSFLKKNYRYLILQDLQLILFLNWLVSLYIFKFRFLNFSHFKIFRLNKKVIFIFYFVLLRNYYFKGYRYNRIQYFRDIKKYQIVKKQERRKNFLNYKRSKKMHLRQKLLYKIKQLEKKKKLKQLKKIKQLKRKEQIKKFKKLSLKKRKLIKKKIKKKVAAIRLAKKLKKITKLKELRKRKYAAYLERINRYTAFGLKKMLKGKPDFNKINKNYFNINFKNNHLILKQLKKNKSLNLKQLFLDLIVIRNLLLKLYQLEKKIFRLKNQNLKYFFNPKTRQYFSIKKLESNLNYVLIGINKKYNIKLIYFNLFFKKTKKQDKKVILKNYDIFNLFNLIFFNKQNRFNFFKFCLKNKFIFINIIKFCINNLNLKLKKKLLNKIHLFNNLKINVFLYFLLFKFSKKLSFIIFSFYYKKYFLNSQKNKKNIQQYRVFDNFFVFISSLILKRKLLFLFEFFFAKFFKYFQNYHSISNYLLYIKFLNGYVYKHFRYSRAILIAKALIYFLKKKRLSLKKSIAIITSYLSVNFKIDGYKIVIAGRLTRSRRGLYSAFKEGKIPLNTIRLPLDYYQGFFKTKFGICGIKVWLNKKLPISTYLLNNVKKAIKFQVTNVIGKHKFLKLNSTFLSKFKSQKNKIKLKKKLNKMNIKYKYLSSKKVNVNSKNKHYKKKKKYKTLVSKITKHKFRKYKYYMKEQNNHNFNF
jgi:hypothetical protein